ncbi:MAG: 1-phosphofructokinase family hexose kinase, partial [Anaerolineae bacterium]
MIYTVTLNPSLDRTLTVRELRVGELNRARRVRLDLSGKGINVSRLLRRLGIASRILGFAGGSTGRAIQDGLTAEGFETIFIEVAGETRQNITILDEATGACTKINEPGASVGPDDLEALVAVIRETAAEGDLWVFSGSLPPGAPADFYAQLIELVQGRGGRAFLDTSGEALRLGLAARPFAIKPNSEEAGELLNAPVTGNSGHLAAARRLQAAGPTLVCLTRGADGLVLAYGEALLLVPSLPVTVVSPIGAGDATLAGLVWAVQEG